MALNRSARCLLLASLSLSLGLCLPAFAASESDPAQVDNDVLQRALRYSGLPAAASAVELDMRGLNYTPDQARAADVAIAKVEAKQTVLIDRDGRFRLRTRTLYPGAIEFGFLTVGSASGSATVDELKWRDGLEIQRDPAETAREDHADLMFLAPALMLREAIAQGAKTTTEGPRTIVGFQDGAGRPATLTVEAASGEIVAASVGPRSYAYSEYREIRGLKQPGRIEQLRDGKLNSVWSEVTLRAADAPAAADFVLPAGYVEKTAPGPLRATALGQGAYRIDGAPSGYHTGFVVGDKSIAVFDAPIDPDEAAQVRATIERAAPGRRIAYVVLSHAHRDHIAGLPAYTADGAVEVFAGARAGVALKRRLGDKAPAKLTELASRRRLDLGGKRVDLYPLDSSHSETMLVGYAPESRTVFQGDLFYLPEVGPVPAAFDGSEELEGLIATERLDVARIVGVHGRSGKREDLAEALRLRKAQARAPVAARCGDSPDPEKVVQAQLEAYNAHDLDAFAACYADAAAIQALGSGKPPRKGIPALREDYIFLKEVPKAYRAEVVNRTVSGPVVVDHERIHGLPPDRGVPEAIAVYEVRDGKILNVWFPPRK